MRVEIATVFVDLSGFTAYTVLRGDTAAADVLGAFRTLTREVAHRRGVGVVKWLGDGAMLVSRDASAAVATALELGARAPEACAPLALRAGVARGPVLRFEGDDYVGVSVNLAARLCDAARPHEVLADTESASSLPGWAHAVSVGPRTLKGFAHPVEVAVVGRRLPPNGVRDKWPLVPLDAAAGA